LLILLTEREKNILGVLVLGRARGIQITYKEKTKESKKNLNK